MSHKENDKIVDDVKDREHDKYYELIMAVANKYPNETRHQTALRYIKEAESCKESDIGTKEQK